MCPQTTLALSNERVTSLLPGGRKHSSLIHTPLPRHLFQLSTYSIASTSVIGHVTGCLKGFLLVTSHQEVDALMAMGALTYSCPLNIKILGPFLGKLKQCIFKSPERSAPPIYFFSFFFSLVGKTEMGKQCSKDSHKEHNELISPRAGTA